MKMLDLLKATVVCGLGGFLAYNYPVLSQAVTMGLLGLVWLMYALQAVSELRRR